VQHNCLDEFYAQSQDFSMPPDKEHEKSAGNFLYIATAKTKGHKTTITITRGKLIEQLMSKEDLKDTGVGDLKPPQLAALNAFLDPSLVLAPGPISH
jgi:hypothetical protein